MNNGGGRRGRQRERAREEVRETCAKTNRMFKAASLALKG